ncbi:uncharacterized protein K452DRAFT_301996 [Aplosporella prunicola CBS 121167]|uniref:Uncharacterized protein n=1 Tax=Aplosporella prunicola CBS 121167 TaxID=1176127 RepID=A0A6A6B2D4_9PEZI|nr:uncharacterized protein K452DRAFT_301996 [Aplosporella prunicola CBS 121167]KAF2137415.1 hypothetical protein K452DRAFT_301996 [Aplosporella prunicola CBS 121167]
MKYATIAIALFAVAGLCSPYYEEDDNDHNQCLPQCHRSQPHCRHDHPHYPHAKKFRGDCWRCCKSSHGDFRDLDVDDYEEVIGEFPKL